MTDDLWEDDRYPAEQILSGVPISDLPVAALVIAELLDAETGDLTLRVISSKGLRSWRRLGMLVGATRLTEAEMSQGWVEDNDDGDGAGGD